MKRVLIVLTFTAVLVFAFATAASAKYASYDSDYNYLPWTSANVLYKAITSETTTQTSPHGGYTQTSVKCAICHSVHRAFSGNTTGSGTTSSPSVTTARTSAGLGSNYALTNGSVGCVSCHAAWGASPSDALVEVGKDSSGPHIGNGGSTCTAVGCHGSVHGAGTQSKYAMVRKYNLTNTHENIDDQITAAIAAGNVVKVGSTDTVATTTNSTDGSAVDVISEKSLDPAMKAYVTGYVCSSSDNQCHGASRSVANSTFSTVGVSASYKAYGHLSTGVFAPPYVPTCEGCHDVIGVATDSTAFPHADRGIDVYYGRYNQKTQEPVTSTEATPTDNTNATRYGLWMTSAGFGQDATATPLAGPVADTLSDFYDATESSPSTADTNIYKLKTDGVCLKCHQTSDLIR
ncbi:MAG: hypothetical protein JJE36_03195 [Coriobacteriia bacterium]|nr:hypothetical protein [Coriobacteriia bacterium]